MLGFIRIISSDATLSLYAIAEAIEFFYGKAVAYADQKMSSLIRGVRQGYAASVPNSFAIHGFSMTVLIFSTS